MPWIAMMLRGTRVLARASASGEPVVGSDGRVEVRYKAQDTRAYRAAKRNLEVIAGEMPVPDDAVAAAAPAAATTNTKADRAQKVAAQKHPDGTIIVYADGACSGNPGPAGIGVVIQDGGVRRELSQFLGEGTNNIAELTAVLEAAHAITDHERPVRFHTDSKYAIGLLSLGWKAKANTELVARVREALKPFKDLQLIHVPGHAGVLLNERADALAVQAVKSAESSGWKEYGS
jgi:ribonuclease HI